MNKLFTFLLIFAISNSTFAQISEKDYLTNNRIDLLKPHKLEIGEAKIIGLGALHGSSKTETTEIILLENLVKEKNLKFYLPETDFSTANYFQQYIETGDEELLKELVKAYGTMVPQEKSIEVFEKWKVLRPLFLDNEVTVLGVDKISSYKFTVKELIAITKNNSDWKYRDSLKALYSNPETNWTAFYPTSTRQTLRRFVEDFEKNKSAFLKSVIHTTDFNHIIKNIKHTYETRLRKPFIFENYLILKDRYNLDESLHFARFGIFHLMKGKINNSESFFHLLVKNGTYQPNEILTIQGFLTKSSVLWNTKYDKEGNYKGYSIKRGYGIGDYWLEYFHGIKDLKKTKLSDITLFYLNSENTPYNKTNEFKLVKIKQLLSRSFWEPTEDQNTSDYIDYAILISNSEANIPIEEGQ